MTNDHKDALRSLQEDIHQLAVAKGWWDVHRDIPHCLALIHSEVSEALEEYRELGPTNVTVIGYEPETGKPTGVGIELADVLIRIFDLCERHNIDLARCLEVKHAFNATRPYRHGKRC